MPRIRKSQNNQPTINRIVWRIAVYIRLSKDDGNDESLSVTNQRKIITEYIEEFFEGEMAAPKADAGQRGGGEIVGDDAPAAFEFLQLLDAERFRDVEEAKQHEAGKQPVERV